MCWKAAGLRVGSNDFMLFSVILVDYGNSNPSIGCAGEEVVDLTCEGSELTVVDLTSNDSVVVSLSFLYANNDIYK
jgi:hypothetical protein